MVKKRMSCLMGCQECNPIIMKSDSGELAGWMDVWIVTEGGRERPTALSSCLSIFIVLAWQKQVSRFLSCVIEIEQK